MTVPAERQIRILIADGQSIFREGVRKLLESEGGFQVIGEATTGDEALELVNDLRPDLLLLDFSMSRRTDLEILRRILKISPSLRTILLTVSIDKSEMLQALRFGARGVVPKQSESGTLFKSIRAVMAGEFWVSRNAIAALVEILRGPRKSANTGSDTCGLTRRELDVIAAVVEGQVNKDIAHNFHLSEHTVKHHLTRIFEKLGVSNRVELAMYAVHHDLIRLLDRPPR
jgi:two-component system nitrate/nitrite response regulator NarL